MPPAVPLVEPTVDGTALVVNLTGVVEPFLDLAPDLVDFAAEPRHACRGGRRARKSRSASAREDSTCRLRPSSDARDRRCARARVVLAHLRRRAFSLLRDRGAGGGRSHDRARDRRSIANSWTARPQLTETDDEVLPALAETLGRARAPVDHDRGGSFTSAWTSRRRPRRVRTSRSIATSCEAGDVSLSSRPLTWTSSTVPSRAASRPTCAGSSRVSPRSVTSHRASRVSLRVGYLAQRRGRPATVARHLPARRAMARRGVVPLAPRRAARRATSCTRPLSPVPTAAAGAVPCTRVACYDLLWRDEPSASTPRGIRFHEQRLHSLRRRKDVRRVPRPLRD